MVRASDPAPWSDEDLAALLADGVPFIAACPSATTPDFWPSQAELPTRDTTEPTWDHLMPELESEWAAGRRQQQVLLRLFPRRLQRLIHRSRTTFLRECVLDLVANEVMRRAAREDRLFETVCSTEELAAIGSPRSYVPATDMRRLLREVAADDSFMLSMFKEVKAAKRQARAVNTWTSCGLPSHLPRNRLRASGTILLESWCGLTTTALPYCAPEGLLVSLARRFWRDARVGSPKRPLRVMDWGAGNSPFTRAVMALHAAAVAADPDAPKRWRLEHVLLIDEVDVLGDSPPELAFARRTEQVPANRVYDFVLIQLPPPCVGRGGHRDRHKEPQAGRVGQARLRDLGRLGVRKWTNSVRRVVGKVLAQTTDAPTVAILIPLFEVGSSAEDGAEALRAVSTLLRDALCEAAAVVTNDVVITATETSEQWRCVVASRLLRDFKGQLTRPEEIDAIDALIEASE